MQDQQAHQIAQARLAFLTAGQPPLCGPRRATSDEEPAQEAAVSLSEQTSAEPRRFSMRHAAALAVLLLIGIAIALVTITRSSATAVPVTVSSGTAAAGDSPRVSPSASASSEIRVHVTGAVASPGVVRLPSGAIVLDAIDAAGGLTEDADPAELNLAAPLSDGAQVMIGTRDAPSGEVVGASPTGENASESGLINLNEASASELEELPGIGPVTAASIISWREENGKFTAVEELQEISGIGPKTYAKIAALVTV